MSKILTRDSNSISIATFYENYCADKYNFSPSYQRESIWSDEKKSFLIDSIMRNFPIPPIFLRQRINVESGKTSFDIIDGKQRLTSIISFIENNIPVSTEEEPIEEEIENQIAGVFFSELDKNEVTKTYKKNFWRYAIPIEYIDTEDDELIKHIFDRLNRNGEPLTGQELRNAKYSEFTFLKKIIRIASSEKWIKYLTNVDIARMENIEFISELIFATGESKPLKANQDELDNMYANYIKKSEADLNELFAKFHAIEDFLEKLEVLDYCQKGVSHFYSIWCFSMECTNLKIQAESVKSKIDEFYTQYFSQSGTTKEFQDYKRAMSSNTKSSTQRTRRTQVLLEFCQVSTKGTI